MGWLIDLVKTAGLKEIDGVVQIVYRGFAAHFEKVMVSFHICFTYCFYTAFIIEKF